MTFGCSQPFVGLALGLGHGKRSKRYDAKWTIWSFQDSNKQSIYKYRASICRWNATG